MNLSDARIMEILLVEDNPGDVLLTREAFKQSKIKVHLEVAKDGEVALQMLRKQGEYAKLSTPDLVLLDLNIPKKDGREVLKEIKEDDELKRMPVIIMTSSKAETDVIKTYNLHANSYIVKPVNMDSFIDIVKSIENFWFTVVVLPSEAP